MSDFSKKSDPPVTASDDTAPTPIMPFSIAADVPALNPNSDGNDQSADDAATDREGAPYWHPAWEAVQDRFEQEIAARNPAGGANTHRDLPADEFKIRMIVDSDVVGILETIMEDVKRAVESIEQRPKPAKQSTNTNG